MVAFNVFLAFPRKNTCFGNDDLQKHVYNDNFLPKPRAKHPLSEAKHSKTRTFEDSNLHSGKQYETFPDQIGSVLASCQTVRDFMA